MDPNTVVKRLKLDLKVMIDGADVRVMGAAMERSEGSGCGIETVEVRDVNWC